MALPASDDDIVKLLENSPTLKALLDLPARVAALEAKVKKLEGGPAPASRRAVTNPCPYCGGQMKLTDETDSAYFGVFGVKTRTFECEDCGRTTTRDYDPAKG